MPERHLAHESAFDAAQALELRTIILPSSGFNAIAEKADGDARIARSHLLSFYCTSPRPALEEIVDLSSQPEGSEWRCTLAVARGQYVISDFILEHERVVTTVADGKLFLNCSQCLELLAIPLESIPPSQSHWRIREIVGSCEEDSA